MTLGECIAQADALRPNSATEGEKARWALELEEELTGVFFPRYQGPGPVADPPRRWPEDGSKTLSASGPYEGLYLYRLLAQMDLMDQEMEQYGLHAALANRLLDEFKKEWHRRHARRDALCTEAGRWEDVSA